MFNVVFSLALSSFLLGCQSPGSSLLKGPCQALDWHELGRADGVRGLPSVSWEQKAARCTTFTNEHHQIYLGGWHAGVDQFCQADHAFHFGQMGESYHDVCSKDRAPDFLANYQRGLAMLENQKALGQIRANLKKLQREREQVATAIERQSLFQRIQALKAKQRVHEKEMARIKSQARQQGLR